MALDIHTYEHGKMGQLLFQIDDKLYGDLLPMFELFREKTGCFIDPYGDLIVDESLGTLIECISFSTQTHKLTSILQKALHSQTPIIFVGD